MNNDTKFAKAHQAIGQYFSEFSELERELGEAVKVVLHLEGHDAADIVVAMLRYPRTKALLVREAAKIARRKDGSETSTKWKARADKTLGRILEHNENSRDPLADSHLEPLEDGSVKVTRRSEGRGTSKVWNLKNKIAQVQRLTEELREIRAELSKLDVQVGKIQWIRSDAWHPRKYLEPPYDQTQGPLVLREEG